MRQDERCAMDLGQMLARTASRTPDKTAIIFRDQETSFGALNRRANQVANGLIGLGIQPGDRVALFIHNLPIFMQASDGTLKARTSALPLNPLYKPVELDYIFND